MIAWIGFLLSIALAAGTESPRFRLHLMNEPSSLAPYQQKNSANHYLLGQLSCPLLKWQDDKVKPWGADCHFENPIRVRCKINPDLKFDDGTKVTAGHYLKNIRAFLNPQHPSPRADLLESIHNAKEVRQGLKPMDQLGVTVKKGDLVFNLTEPDPDFLLTLAHPFMTAIYSDELPTPNNFAKFRSCGPYQFESWETGRKIILKPNSSFPFGHPERPQLEYVFFSEDSIALQAYQKNELDFLRRLPTLFIPKWEGSPEFHKVDQLRFDYVGFDNTVDRNLIRALSQSADFEAWRALFSSKPRPGCDGMPDNWTQGPVCWNVDLDRARQAFSSLGKIQSPKIYYSKQGGDDLDREMQFLQAQWKKNLGLGVSVESQENKIFQENLRAGKIHIFRKGLNPDRPSCRAILGTFSEHHPENFVHFHDTEYEKILRQLAKPNVHDRAALCRRGVEILRDRAGLLMTGPIFFSILMKPQWQGWTLNDLNDLDLSGLHLVSGK